MFVYNWQEGDFAMRMSEMKEDMRHREMTIRNLEDQTNQLQAGINDMSKELEMKGKEILRIRSEANQAAKYDHIFWHSLLDLYRSLEFVVH